MFVKKSTYADAVRLYVETKRDLNKITDKWNKLVEEINIKGGADFLHSGKPQTKTIIKDKRLTDREIKKLISLCHPDKHGNSDQSSEMTKRLLSMRSA